MIEIIEVLGRSQQGITRPFLCRGDDGSHYYVKGRGAGRRSQLCEWTAAHLASALHLPLAPFEIVDVPAALLRFAVSDLGLHELGAGPAFASLEVEGAAEFSVGDRALVPPLTRQAILVFDWWIANQDRTLTDEGGNPNLLWDVINQRVVMIDHNLAFDLIIDGPLFMHTHVFGSERDTLWSDLAERALWSERLSSALPAFDTACDNAPEEWWFADDDSGVPVNFAPGRVRALLEKCARADFWKIEP